MQIQQINEQDAVGLGISILALEYGTGGMVMKALGMEPDDTYYEVVASPEEADSDGVFELNSDLEGLQCSPKSPLLTDKKTGRTIGFARFEFRPRPDGSYRALAWIPLTRHGQLSATIASPEMVRRWLQEHRHADADHVVAAVTEGKPGLLVWMKSATDLPRSLRIAGNRVKIQEAHQQYAYVINGHRCQLYTLTDESGKGIGRIWHDPGTGVHLIFCQTVETGETG